MDIVCIPADLTAFVLNDKSCDGPSYLAPITQPNYMGLQLENNLIQHDVLDHVDLHLSTPIGENPRLADPSTNPFSLRQNRLGVYLHWSLPRLYRTATAKAKQPDGTQDASQPVFRNVPNRWLVIRHLNMDTRHPKIDGQQDDRVRKIDDITDDKTDLEVDCVPFVAASGSNDPTIFAQQIEVFLGRREAHLDWTPGKVNQQPGYPLRPEDAAPTPGLTVMNSSNPLFPDYVMHNSNVFSMIDSFQMPNTSDHLDTADADYFVLGWHTDRKDSPLFDSNPGAVATLSSRLATLLLQMPDGDSDQAVKDILKAHGIYNVLVHGSIYGVNYRKSPQQKTPSAADEVAVKFTPDVKMEPLSMGTTALDGILTFLEAHNKDHSDDEESIFGSGTSAIAEDVLSLASLLYASDDSYNERVKAQDLLYTTNYAKDAGGFEWHFAGKAGQSTNSKVALPSPTEQGQLASLNGLQSEYDSLASKLQSLRWDMFSHWWKFVSDPGWTDTGLQADYTTKVRKSKKLIIDANARVGDLSQQITRLSKASTFKRSARDPFFIRKDPTLCIAGVKSGWPDDFLDKAVCRLAQQGQLKSRTTSRADAFFSQAGKPLFSDSDLRTPARKLFEEFLDRVSSPSLIVTSDRAHRPWGGKNPFQPLFIEWEAQYYHIDRHKWSVGVSPSPVGHKQSQVRYRLNSQLSAADQKDVRTISGRVILTPQPSFSLEAVVKQVISSGMPKPEPVTPDPNKPTPAPDPSAAQATLDPSVLPLTQKEIDDVLANIRKLQFISAPLSGLTEHLLTRYEGSHVKPNYRTQGQSLTSMKAAKDKCKAIDADVDKGQPSMVDLIGPESALTPYANLLSFDSKNYPGVPFKPATHGQMFFTKLNLIDKFGQAVCVIEPKPTPRPRDVNDKRPLPPLPSTLYPCISDFLSPDPWMKTEKLNTVYDEDKNDVGDKHKWPVTRFIQLTPSINQNARINASFLNANLDNKAPYWHETNDDTHESPVFGWLVLNYQDQGLQFFCSDGTFYREVRVGGPTGTVGSSKWLPFDPPSKAQDNGNRQLDEFIGRVTTYVPTNDDGTPVKDETPAKYLQALFDMINGAIKNMPYPPSDYAAFANSIVGKPLALVNIGWSLELQGPPLKYQNTLGNKPPNDQDDLLSYKFPIKIGDKDRPFDGMVGYCMTDNPSSNMTHWDKLFTYFPSTAKDATKRFVNLTANQLFPLSPYFNDPALTSSIIRTRTDKYTVITAIIDPYTPVHAFSPSLPIKSLRLQPWTIQQAFSRMTAFFRLGPHLLSGDVPLYVDKPLSADTWNTSKGPPDPSAVSTTGKTAAAPIRLPISGRKGMWQWLQPYDLPGKDAKADRITRFNAMDVGEEDTKIRKERAPYTYVEGYLQLARPLLKEDIGISGGT
ncbi:hypothetical protein B0A48_10949 [Cryoendolithus antarcticus]|uniref:Uncharacterized protein n=1 Tax=Cryoendolithus antarcticus TaxID=1507870 RepID=A0A1V8SZF5_9PEZI|nr:hypothetical protein B0A48_10949 [Cryoendolithus antarcticus]